MKLKTYIQGLIISLILILVCTHTQAQIFKLSENSKVSILTCSPGPDLYEIFGHTAIRVSDKVQGLDIVYNYGTFNFNTPNFYLKFATGELLYTISSNSFSSFMGVYRYYQRSVTEQTLDLKLEERQKIFEALLTNSLPENREYKYDFQIDNCATRIRDIIEKNCNKEIKYEYKEGETYRDILNVFLKPISWTKWGINILLGSRTDKTSDARGSMFIPDYLKNNLELATIDGKPLVKKQELIYKAKQTVFSTPWYLQPIYIISLIIFLLIGYSIKTGKNILAIDIGIFTLIGIVGTVVYFMNFFSNYYSTGCNYNLLLFNPQYLLAILLIRKNLNRIATIMLYICALTSLLYLLIFHILPLGIQEMPIENIPIAIYLIFTAYKYLKLGTKKGK
ncbi:DUF4105 domain-containing protein [Marinilabiliaceae bacterium JC040]|nr:DUF4105 domain-containing protein [Marinilabiliaceae bacterium JC040]